MFIDDQIIFDDTQPAHQVGFEDFDHELGMGQTNLGQIKDKDLILLRANRSSNMMFKPSFYFCTELKETEWWKKFQIQIFCFLEHSEYSKLPQKWRA